MIHETCGHNPVMQSDGRCVACDAYECGKDDGFARGLLEAGARWARQVIQTKAALESQEKDRKRIMDLEALLKLRDAQLAAASERARQAERAPPWRPDPTTFTVTIPKPEPIKELPPAPAFAERMLGFAIVTGGCTGLWILAIETLHHLRVVWLP